MTNCKTILRTLCAGLLAPLVLFPGHAQTLKREMRSTWFTTVWAIDWPSSRGTSSSVQTAQKNELNTYLDNFKSLNFNCVFFQVRGMADAFYKSSYEPWSANCSGTRGTSPGYDPLEYAVEQCHNRGLECYAWVNPFRQGGNTSTTQDKKWASDGLLLTYGNYTVFNPGLEAARTHVKNVITEIISNYKIDGLVFDDYFYCNNIPETSAAPDYELYKSSGTKLAIGDWRRENINSLIREIQAIIDQKRPDLRFGISPAGVAYMSASKYGLSRPAGVSASDWQYKEIYSDPLAWLADGSIDFISPQIYWLTTHSTAPYEPLAKWWTNTAAHFGRHFYSSHSLSILEDDNTASNRADIVKQIDANRKYATFNTGGGSVWYSSKHFKSASSEITKEIKNNAFTTTVLPPEVTWKKGPAYSPVANATKNGSTLSWTAATNGNAIIRYTVYAVPTSLNYDDALTSDGIDAKYLLGISYKPTFALPSGKTSGYWYAISVFDGYGKEHEPAFVGYTPQTKPDANPVSLLAPANGATVSDPVEFSWSKSSNATQYTLQVASTNTFAEIKYSSVTANTSLKVAASHFGLGTHYWRVIAGGTGLEAKASETRSFVINHLDVGAYEQGYTIKKDPAAYADFGNYTFQNLWVRAQDSPFANITFADNGTYERAMVADADYVYVTRRSENSAGATLFLDCYNASTGEKIKTLTLHNDANDAQVSYFPMNNICKDANGTLVIFNLTLNASSTPLVMHKVDTNTGLLTKVAEVNSSSTARIDHASVYGNVSTGNFTIFAAPSTQQVVLRWVFKNGSLSNTYSSKVTTFYPSTSNYFGVAPRVYPVSDSEVIVNGGAVHPTHLTLSSTSSTLKSNFSGVASDLMPKSAEANGVCRFAFEGTNYTLYPYQVAEQSGGYKFALVSHAGTDLKSASKVAVFPESGLGTVNSSTMSTPVDAVVSTAQKSVNLYAMATGNGLAAYRFINKSAGVEDLTPDAEAATVTAISGGLSIKAKQAQVFNAAGVLLKTIEGDGDVRLTSGLYIVRTGGITTKHIVK